MTPSNDSRLFTCLIVEDEPLAQQILIDYIHSVPCLSLCGIANNVFDATALLQIQKPDITLLDINLPMITGLDWLRSLDAAPPNVILTTANPSYALESYELNIVDYLLKPIRLERFIKAITRVQLRTQQLVPISNPDTILTESAEYFFVKESNKIVRINFCDIIVVEGMDDYVRIHKKDINNKVEVILTFMRMHKIASLLPTTLFLRLHRSYIINRLEIIEMHGSQLTLTTGMQITSTKKYAQSLKELQDQLRQTMPSTKKTGPSRDNTLS